MPRDKPNSEVAPSSDAGHVEFSGSKLGFWIAVTILLVALVIRGFVCFRSFDSYTADPDGYQAFAFVLSTEGSFGVLANGGKVKPSAFRPPLYPFLLSILPGKLTGEFPDVQVSAFTVACLHTLLGCLTALCTFLAARRMISGNSWIPSILAALVVIVDPILLQQTNLVMTETLATAITSVILWWWVRHCDTGLTFFSAIVLGILVAMAYLCRPTFLVWGLLLCLGSVFAPANSSDTTKSKRLANAFLMGLILLSTVAAWTLRNQRAIGHPVWATSHGGYTLLLGNNPSFYDYLRNGEWGTAWDANGFLAAIEHRFENDMASVEFWEVGFKPVLPTGDRPRMSEQEDDQLCYNAAVATIRREPKMFFYSCVVRVARLWTPFLHQTQGRSRVIMVAIGAYYVMLYLAVLVAVRRMRVEILQTRWWPALMLVFTLSCVHALYWSNMRMRAPAIPVIAIAAAAALRAPQTNRLLVEEKVYVANE